MALGATLGSTVRLGSCAEGAGQEGDSIAGRSLGEDRFKVVLNRVLGQGHLVRQRARVAASSKQAQKLIFAGAEAEGAAEKLQALGGSCLLNGDDDS